MDYYNCGREETWRLGFFLGYELLVERERDTRVQVRTLRNWRRARPGELERNRAS